jgi:outer membrane biosynthesis protein TonB
MLLIGGGLVYWKLGSRVEEPAPAVVPSAPEVDQAPMLDTPPPPPPSIEEPEDGGAPAAAKQVRSAADPCRAPCEGRENASLLATLRGKGAQARACYERGLRTNATLQGKMTVSVRVGANGQVCSATASGDTLGDPGVTNCVLGQFRASALPPPQGGCVNVQVPLNFVPKKP